MVLTSWGHRLAIGRMQSYYGSRYVSVHHYMHFRLFQHYKRKQRGVVGDSGISLLKS